MTRVLLDSDVIIWCLRGRRDVVDMVADLARDTLPACSALSVLEVEIGMKPGEEILTRALLRSMDIRAVDGSVASRAATFIREYRRKGVTLDFVDATIAATCILQGLRLATFNKSHYPMPGLEFAAG